jgi:hypothetical protein
MVIRYRRAAASIPPGILPAVPGAITTPPHQAALFKVSHQYLMQLAPKIHTCGMPTWPPILEAPQAPCRGIVRQAHSKLARGLTAMGMTAPVMVLAAKTKGYTRCTRCSTPKYPRRRCRHQPRSRCQMTRNWCSTS